jgi:putative acetyltransferase
MRRLEGTTHMLDVRQDDLSSAEVRALLALHLAGMHASTPAGHVYALDLGGLQAPNVTVWTAWHGEAVVSVGALKELGDGTGEVKSMRTHPAHLRRGGAAAILSRIVAEARARGLGRLSLETGTGPSFGAALALYRRYGFRDGAPFGDYAPSAHNQFLHLDLGDAPG